LELGETINQYKTCVDPLSYKEIGEIIGKSKEATRSLHRRWKKRQGKKTRPEQNFNKQQKQIWNEKGNYAESTFKTRRRITTLEDLVAVAHIDTDEWMVDHWLVNQWEVGAKAKDQELEWTDGIVNGYTSEHGLTVEPLYQVKAWLVRRHPIAIKPIIQPVQCDYEFEWGNIDLITGQRCKDIQTSLVFGDPHFGFERDMQGGRDTPYHNESVLRIILEIAKYVQPDRIDIIGDILDLAEWSDKFIRTPEMTETTQKAINAAYRWLKEFRSIAPKAEMFLYQGNHELRIQKALITHLRAAYGIRPADKLDLPPAMSVPNLLALNGLGIQWVDGYPHNQIWINNGLQISHGDIVRSAPGDTSKAVSKNSDVSQVYGHIHRVEMVTHTHNFRNAQKYVTAFSPGCACWCDDRVPGNGHNRQWQNGCGIIEYEVDGGRFNITPILIEDRKAIYDGKIFGG